MTMRSAALTVRSSGLPQAGQWRAGFAVGDLNNDGAVDVLHGPPRQTPGKPRLWSWRGDRFVEANVSWPDVTYDYGAAAIGDFDGDGDNDAAFAMHTIGIRVLLREGAMFRDAGLVPFSSRAMVAAQLDDDPALELVAVADGPVAGADVSNTGIATFDVDPAGEIRYSGIDASTGLIGDAIISLDFDGDGRDDLASGSSVQGFATLLYLRRDGGFVARPVPIGQRDVVRAVAALPTRNGNELVFATTPPGHGALSSLLRVRFSEGELVSEATPTKHALTALTGLREGLVALTTSGDAVVFASPGLVVGTPVPVTPGCTGQHAHAIDLGAASRYTLVASFGSERRGACVHGGAIVLLASP